MPRGSYRHDLDGLRAVAVGLVLLDHAEIPFPSGVGSAGVGAFFVLSGYVITNVLRTGDPLRYFYARRALRLFPAVGLLVAFVAVVGVMGGWTEPWRAGIATTLLYVTNWANVAGIATGPMAHTWSLAIEEQFYLVWPIAMIVAPRRLLLPVALVGAAVGAAIYSETTYYSTLANGGAILAGCALALTGRTLPRLAGLVGLALIVVGAVLSLHTGVVIGALLVIAGPIGALEPLAPMGLRAYGLYLWNSPCLLFLGPAGIIPAVVIAEASYRFLETPLIRRYRGRLSPRPAAARGPIVAIPT